MSLSHIPARAGDPRGLAQRLRHRISLQTAHDVHDDAGGVTRSWEEVGMLWAEILPVSSGRGERVFAEQLTAGITHRITIRYRSGVTAAQRIVYQGRSFNIRSVVNVGEAGVILEIQAEEGVAV